MRSRPGSWFVFDALPGDAFAGRPDDLWPMVLRRQGGLLAAVAHYPTGPVAELTLGVTRCDRAGRGVYYCASARREPGRLGAVAQLVAHHTGSVGVRGSSPLGSTPIDVR